MAELTLQWWQRWHNDIMATAHFRGPKPYTPGADFSLWRRRFESYARAAKSMKVNPEYLMRFLPYWMMQPSVYFTFWDLQKKYGQTTSSWSKPSLDDLPLLQESPTTFSVGTTPSKICRDVGRVCWCLFGPCKPGIPWVEPWGANAPRSRPICGRCHRKSDPPPDQFY